MKKSSKENVSLNLSEERLKSSSELLNNVQLEERDQTIMAMELQISQLEERNAELGEQLNENINSQQRKLAFRKNVQVQV